MTQPAPVGGRFVLYAHRNGSLETVALDARDGSTAWTAAATPSDVTAGVPAELAVRGDLVFYLAPGTGPLGAARVVARNAASGRIVWRGPLGAFFTWPEICPDETAAVCVNGLTAGGAWGQLRYAATDGRLLAAVRIGSPNYPGRELGPGLFDAGARSPETLLAVTAGRVAWQRRLADVFTLPRASSDGGWDFDRSAGGGVFVGSVGVTPVIKNGKGSVDLKVAMTAGFRIRDGGVVWRSPGTYLCGQPLPCPGRAQSGYTSPSAVASGPSVGIRMLARGTVSFSTGGGIPKVSHDASATLQGFDPATGRTIWSFAAGRDVQLMSDEGVPPLLGKDVIALRSPSGRIVGLDLARGKTSTVLAHRAAWCETTIRYRLSHAQYYAGKSGVYVGQSALHPCTADGRHAAIPARPPSFVGAIGSHTAGMTAWSDAAAVHARAS